MNRISPFATASLVVAAPLAADPTTHAPDFVKQAGASDLYEKVYVRQQVMAHQQALALHTAFAQGGDKPALKQAASGIVPVVQHHLDEPRGTQGAATTGR